MILFSRFYSVIITSLIMIFILLFMSAEKKEENTRFLIIYVILLISSVLEFFDAFYEMSEDAITERMIVATLIKMIRPLIVIFVSLIIKPGIKKKVIYWIPFGVNFICYIANIYGHFCFWYSEGNIYEQGPLKFCEFVISIIYAVILIYNLRERFINAKVRDRALWIMFCLAGIGGAVLDLASPSISNYYIMSIAIVVSLYYLYLKMKFDTEKELLAQITLKDQKMKLQETQSDLMLSQIQPHFIYNTLSSVKFLIADDPKLAEEVIDNFSSYLRANMDAIGKNETITFDRELEHVECYVAIEKIRFPHICVEYNIEDSIFDLPPLTIQPIVENAIKHGIRRVENGKVLIHSYYRDNSHVIEIKDNGVGFNTQDVKKNIGIENVRIRLENMLGAKLFIESEINVGTTVTIIVPETEDYLEDISC